MDFIVTDEFGSELKSLPIDVSIDMELGGDSKNDFTLTMDADQYDGSKYARKHMVYAESTEYGGVIRKLKSSTSSKTVTLTCDTWRFLLSKKIVEPPAGEAYRYVSGDLHAVMRELLGRQYDDLFVVSEDIAGISVTNFKVSRYITLLEAMEDVLSSVDYRLRIAADGSGDTLVVVLSAVPIVDRSGDVEVSQDGKLDFIIEKVEKKYNYMIAAGKGELEDRTIIYVHLKDDGTCEKIASIPEGRDVNVYFYDYNTIEDDDQLFDEAVKKFGDINDKDSQDVTIGDDDTDYEIGDIVGGRDYITGTHVSAQIASKILKVTDGKLTIEYKLG